MSFEFDNRHSFQEGIVEMLKEIIVDICPYIPESEIEILAEKKSKNYVRDYIQNSIDEITEEANNIIEEYDKKIDQTENDLECVKSDLESSEDEIKELKKIIEDLEFKIANPGAWTARTHYGL